MLSIGVEAWSRRRWRGMEPMCFCILRNWGIDWSSSILISFRFSVGLEGMGMYRDKEQRRKGFMYL